MTLILDVWSSFPSLNLIWFLTNNWTKSWQAIGGRGRAENLDSLDPRGLHLRSARNILPIHLQILPQSSESHSPDPRTSHPIIANPAQCLSEGLEIAVTQSISPSISSNCPAVGSWTAPDFISGYQNFYQLWISLAIIMYFTLSLKPFRPQEVSKTSAKDLPRTGSH